MTCAISKECFVGVGLRGMVGRGGGLGLGSA